MLAHYVIGFEFILLAAIFWYAFVRRPKSFKLDKFAKGSDPWGVYEHHPRH
jgi:hypothetical protein